MSNSNSPNPTSRFGKVLVAFILAVIVIIFSVSPQSAPIKEGLEFQDLFSVLGGIFVIVLLVERATEIPIIIWRNSEAEFLKEKIDELESKSSKAVELLNTKKKLVEYKTETKGISLLISFSLAVVVCAAGVGLLATILDIEEANEQFLRGVDIVLTAGLISGGSDSFHQFVSALEAFFKHTKISIEKAGAAK